MPRYLWLLFYVGTARAACFGKDASFNPTLVSIQYTYGVQYVSITSFLPVVF
jgi:hypothetical protein